MSPQHLQCLLGQVLVHLLEPLQDLVEVEVIVGHIDTCAGDQEVRNVELVQCTLQTSSGHSESFFEDKPGLLAFSLLPAEADLPDNVLVAEDEYLEDIDHLTLRDHADDGLYLVHNTVHVSQSLGVTVKDAVLRHSGMLTWNSS